MSQGALYQPIFSRPIIERPLLVHHVARICGIARRTVRWAARNGLLKGFKLPATPKIWRFLRQDVMDFKNKRDAAHRSSRRATRRAA
jgi:hypothetical protein